MTLNLNAPEPVEANLLNQFEQYRDSDKACPACTSRILMFRKQPEGIEYQCNCGEQWLEGKRDSLSTELILDNFLAKHDPRGYLESPFFLDNYKIFTNGHVMVMHKCEGKDSTKESLIPTVRKFIEQLEKNEDWSPLPDLELKSTGCKSCNGTGKAQPERCGECDGEGEVEWSSGTHDYAADCKACDGDGWWLVPGGEDDCDTCGGSGKRYELWHYMVGESAFNPKYLAMIQAEGTEINQPGKDEMLLFKNGDAFGLIMGIRI